MGALLQGDRKIVRVCRGLAAWAVVALAFLCLLQGDPADAQILDAPGSRLDAPRRPVQLRPSLPDDASAMTEEDLQAFDSGAFGPGQSSRRAAAPPPEDGDLEPGDVLRPSIADETLAAGADAADADPGAIADSDAGEEQTRRPRIPQDGDPVPVIEEVAVRDGIVDAANPWAAEVEDTTEADMRSPDDIRVFSEPAGFDPLLLQADETNPLFRASNFIGFSLDPFPPIGTKIGSFLLFTTLEADYDFNNNLFAAPDALGDSSLELRPAARLASNWSRHAVELRASGDLSYHDKYPSEDDRAYLLEALGRLDVTSRTNLQGLYAHEFAQEGRSAINALSIGTRPNIEVDRVRAAFNHRFNRLSVQLRGNIIDTAYSTNIVDGQVVSNADRDYTLYEQGVRPKWEFSPYLFAFADISFNQRDYNIAAYSDGILRSSTGERYRFGLSFGDVSQILRGNISLGYGRQDIDNHELPVVDGFLIDADLAWQISAITLLSFTATSDVAETTTAYSPGVLERNYGIEARHAFTRYLVGSTALGYMTRDFINTDITNEQFTAAVGAEYYVNPWAVLFTRYVHTNFWSSQPDNTYQAEEVQVGVRLRH